RDATDYLHVKDYNIIAFDLRMSNSLVKSVVEDFGLFEFTGDGKHFYSESFHRRMQKKDGVSEKRSNAAKKRWENMQLHSEDDANALQMHHKNDASKVKRSKVKKREVNNPPLPPLKGGGDFDFSFVREDLKAPFDEWIAYKRSRGQMYKAQRYLRECYSRLENLSGGDAETAMLIVKQSMANNWAGIFELKGKKRITEIIDKDGNRITITKNGGTVGGDYPRNGANPFRTDAENRRNEREMLAEVARTVLQQSDPQAD
ncbi:MAG: hypothetical protein LBL07_15440, partial [Tannerella sp.]|nr:hypothetical protein [Tannerella sp.]